jgi:hypothetical protein
MSPRVLMFPTRKAKIVKVCVWCPCGQFFEPVVKLEPGNDTVEGLPSNCFNCGAMVDTYDNVADAIDSAQFVVELEDVRRTFGGAA